MEKKCINFNFREKLVPLIVLLKRTSIDLTYSFSLSLSLSFFSLLILLLELFYMAKALCIIAEKGGESRNQE